MASGNRRRVRGAHHGARQRKLSRGKGLRSTVVDQGRKLRLEALEDRRVLATFLVNNFGDLDGDGNVVPGSLRAAINAANGNGEADTILFRDFIFGDGAGTINLNAGDNGGELAITEEEPLTIIGKSARTLTIVAAPGSRVFNINDGNDDVARPVSISGVTLTGGGPLGDDLEGRGGAIYNTEGLQLTEVVIENNGASAGGGVFSDIGNVTIERSLIRNNFAGGSGGGVFGGPARDGTGGGGGGDVSPHRVTIRDSTLTGNSTGGGIGGAVYISGGLGNQLTSNTIVSNSSGRMDYGGGVGAFYNPPIAEEGGDPPAPVVQVTLTSNIIFDNAGDPPPDSPPGTPPEGDDINITPFAEEPENGPGLDSILSGGFNFIGVTGSYLTGVVPDGAVGVATDPTNQIGVDPMLISDIDGNAILANYGGATDAFHPDTGSPVIDAGPPSGFREFDQRGAQFIGVFEPVMGVIDVGSVEVQEGNFIVDTLVDERDGRFKQLIGSVGGVSPQIEAEFTNNDFSLREATDFARLNPGPDTITFAGSLTTEDDPTFTEAPTILLDEGSLLLDTEVEIVGNSSFEIEIDGADIFQVFIVDDGDNGALTPVTLDRITVLGGFSLNQGGGVFNSEDLTIRNATIKENESTNDGGGLLARRGNLTVESTTISGNITADEGAGLYIHPDSGPVRITNSTISGNSAGDRGSGIFNRGSDVEVRYSTITLNQSGSLRGAGIGNGADGVITIGGTIISENQFNNDVENLGGLLTNIISDGYNLVGAGNAISQFTVDLFDGDQVGVFDPMLTPLINTGGPTPTHFPLTGSPVIDAGNPMPAMAPTFDQRGEPFARIFDGDLDMDDRIDIGAYELQTARFLVDNPGGGIDNNVGPGELTFPEAVNLANESPLPDEIIFSTMLFMPNPMGPPLEEVILSPNDPVVISDDLKIEGPTVGDLTFTGGGFERLFQIDDGDAENDIVVSFSDFRFQNIVGGGVFSSSEDLTLTNVFFTTIGSADAGGAISQNGGKLTIEGDTTITSSVTSSPNAKGGAIYANNADVTLRDATIVGNNTYSYGSDGGGVAVLNGTLVAEGVTISGNSTPGSIASGAGLFLENVTAMLTNNTVITGNTSTGSNAGGSGIYAKDSDVTVQDSTIAFNTTVGTNSRGAGVQLEGGVFTSLDSIIGFNTTAGMDAMGGGIYSGNADVTLIRTALTENVTNGLGSHGGGIFHDGGTLTIRDSSVSGNDANASNTLGGGVYSKNSGLNFTTILNSTVSGNTANLRGGGVFNAGGLTAILHSTVAQNSTPSFGQGAGVASLGTASLAQTAVSNSIVADNFAASDPMNPDDDVAFVDGLFENTIVSQGYNLVEAGIALGSFNQPGDLTGVDPMLGPLQNNGGFTGTHALLPGSPAIEAGDPAFDPNAFVDPLVNDQRGAGFSRVFGNIDIGSFEVQVFYSDTDADDDVDLFDLLQIQRGFGIAVGATPEDGDANRDGAVSGPDMDLALTELGRVDSGIGAGMPASAASETPPALALATSPNVVSQESSRYSAAVLDAAATGHNPPSGGLLSPDAPQRVVDGLYAEIADATPTVDLPGVAEYYTELEKDDEQEPDDEDAVFESLGDWIV